MVYINENEKSLLQVMADPYITRDTKGRIFEGLVVQRCGAAGVTVNIDDSQPPLIIPKNQFKIHGSKLPLMAQGDFSDGVYVPTNCNFPAVDMIWKSGQTVYGVQVHINCDHDDVASKFWDMCQTESWFCHYTVYLLYLSPNKQCAMKKQPKMLCKGKKSRGKSRQQRATNEQTNMIIKYITILSVECLKDLQIQL